MITLLLFLAGLFFAYRLASLVVTVIAYTNVKQELKKESQWLRANLLKKEHAQA